MDYKWKDGARLKSDAQEIGVELESLQQAHGGQFQPSDIVELARDETAALHEEFEWDDAVAAQQQREDRARYILRALVRVVSDPESERVIEVREYAAVNVEVDDEIRPVYVPRSQAMATPPLREQVLEAIRRRLNEARRDLDIHATLFTKSAVASRHINRAVAALAAN